MRRLMTGIPPALRARRPVLFLVALVCLLALGLAPRASAAGPGFFSPTGSMSVERIGAAAAPLPGGRVLVAGGAYSPDGIHVREHASAELFDPATGTFSSVGIGSMSVPRADAAAAPLPDGRVLVAGGSFFGQFLSSAELFNPATGTFSSAGIGSMFVPRAGAAAAPLPDGRVLVAGGSYFDGSGGHYLSSAEAFDPATNSFSSAGIGSMSVPRPYAAAAALPDGMLVAGGIAPSSAEVFDPATNTFSSAGIGSMCASRSFAAAAPLPDGRVLVAGGNGGGSSAEVFAPGSAPPSPTCGAASAPPSASCRGKQATIVGTDGADRITGTPGADVIAALGGKDRLSGLAGNDVICGAKGDDALKGGAGNDQLSGQKGNDKLYGQEGNDKLSGKAGKDTLKGGPGKDILKGGAGKDKQVQ
jgi:hypothetical protein